MKRTVAPILLLVVATAVAEAPAYGFLNYIFSGSSSDAIENSVLGDLRAWWTGDPVYNFNPYYSGRNPMETGYPASPGMTPDQSGAYAAPQGSYMQQYQQPQQGYQPQYQQPMQGYAPQQAYQQPAPGYAPPQQAYPQYQQPPAAYGPPQGYQPPAQPMYQPPAGYPQQGYQ